MMSGGRILCEIPVPRFFGYVNFASSCFIDSVLIALLLPDYNDFLVTVLRDSASGCGEVKTQLLVEMDALKNATEGYRCHVFRNIVNRHDTQSCFNNQRPNSAVDFVRFLFDLIGVSDNLCTFQTSQTFYTNRPEVVSTESDILKLVKVWLQEPMMMWTADNAHLLADGGADADEKFTLLNDSSRTSTFAKNAKGDRRRINPEQTTSIILCQLTEDDEQSTSESTSQSTSDSTTGVNIFREFLPKVDVAGVIPGYTGDVWVILTANRFRNSPPMLLFEVSRVMFTSRGVLKSSALVNFGKFHRETKQWRIKINDKSFFLQAVVCHLGSNLANGLSNGHYVTYVQPHGSPSWYYYDDAFPSGELSPLPPSMLNSHPVFPKPDLTGELFFYVAL